MGSKNINSFVNDILAIETEEACQAGAIGYMARALIQATMPHSKTENHQFNRKNGAFKLTMLADSEVGLPYGSIPRLLLSWITTEATRTNQRELILGRTLSEFMSELDLIPSGGRWGSITRLKDQMKRLFSTSISCTYDDGKKWAIRNVTPVEKAELWWNPKEPNQSTMWQSHLLLGELFFNEITENPIPIDMRALKVLRRSPMAIDIYCWLTYRMSYLRKITHIPWAVLQVQFGANYKDLRQFKRRFLDQLKKVLCVYSNGNVKEENNNLVLIPGKTHIQRQVTPQNSIYEKISKPNSGADEKSNLNKLNRELQKKYDEYRLNTVAEIVENLPDEEERHRLLKDFEMYLVRTNLSEIRKQIIKGNHTDAVKKELYHFVNNHWHHVLNTLKSYEDFCNLISE